VQNAFKTLRMHGIMQDTEETERFCMMFDRFFDMLNTRAIDEEIRRKKLDLKPYKKVEDERFQVNVSICMYKSNVDYSGWKKRFWVTSLTRKSM